MKKIFFYSLLLLILAILAIPSVSADIIPEDSHYLNRCIKYVNLDSFPDVVLIGYTVGPMIKNYEAYQISNNKCLTKGYKFNTLDVYWTTKTKFDSMNIDDLNLVDLNLLTENIGCYGGYIMNSSPLIKEDIELSIAGFSGEKLVVYTSKRTSEYNNGDPKKTETFANPLLITNFIEQEKKLLTQIDSKLSERVRGKILLQVEQNGEGWYVNPDNQKRYYLGRPNDAFRIMKELGLGVSNKDFDSFGGYAPKRLSGKILLKVEDKGEAFYVNPDDLKMHYLGRPADAFNLMKSLGLGISNTNIRKIDIN